MKAKQKAARDARRRAQSSTRKEDLPRTASGVLSRSAARYAAEAQMTEKEAKVVVLGARQRVYGLPQAVAGLAEAGSALGRLHLAGGIDNRLYRAGNRFAEDVWAYHMVTGIPHPSPRAIDYARVKGRGMDRSAETVKGTTNRYMNALGVIQQTDRAGRPVETTVRNVVLLDMDAASWPPHMVKMLKQGLTALASWYGIGNEQEREA